MEKKIDLNYGCANGAPHDYVCCPTCWNKHPLKWLHLGMLGTIGEGSRVEMVEKAVRHNFRIDAKKARFTKKQADLLFDYFYDREASFDDLATDHPSLH